MPEYKKREGSSFLKYVCSKKGYHFLIRTKIYILICWFRYHHQQSHSFTTSRKLKIKTFDYLSYHSCTQWTQTSFRRLQGVLKRSRRLMTKPDVVKTSGKRRLIYDVMKTSDLRRLEDVVFKTSWRRPIYFVLRTSNLRRPPDVWFTTSWRRPIYVVLKTSNYDVFKTFVKRRLCSKVVVTSI